MFDIRCVNIDSSFFDFNWESGTIIKILTLNIAMSSTEASKQRNKSRMNTFGDDKQNLAHCYFHTCFRIKFIHQSSIRCVFFWAFITAQFTAIINIFSCCRIDGILFECSAHTHNRNMSIAFFFYSLLDCVTISFNSTIYHEANLNSLNTVSLFFFFRKSKKMRSYVYWSSTKNKPVLA